MLWNPGAQGRRANLRNRMSEADTSIADVLEGLAARQPTAAAIRAPGRTTLSYGQLGGQVGYVRERLGHWGIQRGDVVVGALSLRPELAVAIATLPASCAFAPLDPALPTDGYKELLGRLKPKAILVCRGDDHTIRPAARSLGIAEIELTPASYDAAGLFTLDLHPATAALSTGTALDPRVAYVLTSSGTTGRRKLVPAAHSVMLCYARAVADRLQYTPDDIGVHTRPLYFGSGLRSGLMNALLTGSSVVCLPEGDLEGLFAALDEFQPTFLHAGFSAFRTILRRAQDFQGSAARHRFRFMLSGAGPLDLDDADRLEQMFGVPMLTGYSSTETSRISLDPLPPGVRKRGSAGLPLVNDVAVLDGDGEIRPRGVPGEIVARGPMVFQGYLDDPALNAASFVGDWFRTGDLGCIDEDGYVFVTGRINEIINRGGEKISPTEIDLAMESLAGVAGAAAFSVPHPSLGEEVVAAVEREAGADVDEAMVMKRVKARLGARKGPRRVYFIDRLPRTDSGKVQRWALPDLIGTADWRPAPGLLGGSGPESPLEGALAGLWSSLLHPVAVGHNDDFFLLGGDSLSGKQLLAHVKDLFGVHLPLEALYGTASTVAGMARAIEAGRAREQAVAPAPSGKSGKSGKKNRSLDATEIDGIRVIVRLRPIPVDEILARQRDFVRTWPGRRATPASLIVSLNEAGTRPGFFFCLQSRKALNSLTRYLGPDQPVHAMRSGFRVITYTDENVGLLAEHYASEMVALQPDGPFVLGGSCQGSRIARAIASELRERGRDVSLLILLEPRTFPRWNGRVALVFGRDSHFNPYAHGGDPDAAFRRAFPAGYSVDIVPGTDGDFFFPQHLDSVMAVLKRRLLEVPDPPPVAAAPEPDRPWGRRFVSRWWSERRLT